MPVVSDYVVIEDHAVTIRRDDHFTRHFNTGGRYSGDSAFITFSIRSLGEPEDVPVQVNDYTIGKLRNYHKMDARNWFTQTLVFSSSILKNGNNSLEINVNQGDVILDNIIVHFKQNA
ncbi:MAG: hypothetical protein WBA13_19455 [Microcoleaceae cyanobacterium]